MDAHSPIRPGTDGGDGLLSALRDRSTEIDVCRCIANSAMPGVVFILLSHWHVLPSFLACLFMYGCPSSTHEESPRDGKEVVTSWFSGEMAATACQLLQTRLPAPSPA